MMRGSWILALLAGIGLLVSDVAPVMSVAAAQEPSPQAGCPATTAEENLAQVRRFFEEGVNRADLGVFDTVVAPDVVYHSATVGDESGLEALKRTYGEALTGFPGIQYTLLSSVAAADAVALRFAVAGIHRGNFRGLEPTGETITWNHAAFARVECGQIAEMWAEVDQLDRLRALGILAAEGPAARMAGAATTSEGTPAVVSDSSPCATQSPEASIAVVERVRAEVYNEGDFDGMPEMFAEGYLHGSANGPDAIGIGEGAKRIGGFVTALPDLAWTFDQVIATGDLVAARWTTRGTHDGDLLGFAATGKPVEFTGISFFTVQCGKIVEFQTEMDAAGLLEQVGAVVRRES